MSGRILLIEDDAPLRGALTALLSRHGYVVTEAPDADAAFAVLARDPLPDLVVLDVGLPTMDGYEFRRQVLKDARLAALPTVVMTGAEEEEHRAAFPGVEFFSKAGSALELLAAVRRALKQP